MRYASVCAGIEAASVAWAPLRWEPAVYSEIDDFCRVLLRVRHPDVPVHGRDRRRGEAVEDYAEEVGFQTIGASDYGAIDLLVGGTPCQDFSIAGLRTGLDGGRGNLSLEYLRLAHRKRPKWLAWENVPGVLSLNGGRDFGTFLGGLAELGYGFAYRVLDAQFFGVPQRRRRVFVIGYLGDWRRPAAVLFDRHSLQRNSPPRREARRWRPRPDSADAPAILGERSGRVSATFDRQSSGGFAESDVASTASSRDYKDHGDLVLQWPADIAPTFNAAFGQKLGLEDQHALNGGGLFVPARPIYATDGQANAAFSEDVASTFTATNEQPYILAEAVPRRLTPRETERLFGFPDDYTLIEYRGKPSPDLHRYRTLGNSMAVPVMRWLGERIQMVDSFDVERLAA